ncbi:MAG TPA: O-antigen ligase family protein [Thermoanaerobaculia bacterium]|nr:O-antigen ligase family protein [Thermoanaerobaculia bacterium]
MNDPNSSAVMWWAPPIPSAATATPEAQQADGRLAFGATVAFTVILLLSPQNWFPFLRPLRIAFLAAGIGIGSLLWDCWKQRRPLGMTREMLLCFALPAWAFLTLPLSYWPGGSVATLTDLYIKAVLIFWLLPNVVTTPRRLRALAIVLMLCTIPLAGTGVKNFVQGMFITRTDVARIIGYDGGLAKNPNDLALMLDLLIPLGVALFLAATSSMARLLAAGVIAISAAGVVVTFSRAGFLGLAAIGLLYFVRMSRRHGSDRKWAFAMIVIAVLSLPLLPASYVDRLASVKSVDADITGSSQIRWRDNVAAFHYVMQHPIVGAGIGMDAIALNTVRGAEWKNVHNVYFQYAVDLGLPGITLFLVLFHGVLRAAKTSRQRLARSPHRDLFLLCEALEISLVAFGICALFYPVAYHFYFYYMAGLALAARVVTNNVLGPEVRWASR